MGHRQEKLIYRCLLESRLCVLYNYLWILNKKSHPPPPRKLVWLGSALGGQVLSGQIISPSCSQGSHGGSAPLLSHLMFETLSDCICYGGADSQVWLVPEPPVWFSGPAPQDLPGRVFVSPGKSMLLPFPLEVQADLSPICSNMVELERRKRYKQLKHQ